MKFVVDAQLPRSLSVFLCAKDHDSIHTLDLPEKNRSSDGFITQLSIEQDRIVITKDSDFLKSFLIYNRPKKLLLIKTGNIPNPHLLLIIEKQLNLICTSFISNSLIEITRTELIVHK